MTFSFTEKKRIRKDFGKQKPALDVPDLLTLQVESYEKFLQKDLDAGKRKNIGLQAAFNNLFPIHSSKELQNYLSKYLKQIYNEVFQKDLLRTLVLKTVLCGK